MFYLVKPKLLRLLAGSDMSSEEDMNRSREEVVMSKSYLFTAAFWRGAIERMSRLTAAILLGMYGFPAGGEAVGAWDVPPVDLASAARTIVGAVIGSLLISIVAGGSGIGPTGSPSLVNDRPSPADLAEAQRIEREHHVAKHADDGIDVALDDPEVPR